MKNVLKVFVDLIEECCNFNGVMIMIYQLKIKEKTKILENIWKKLSNSSSIKRANASIRTTERTRKTIKIINTNFFFIFN